MLSNHSLLSASIQSLLQSEASFQFYTVAADEPKMSTKIKQKNPHTIIIDSDDASLGDDVITRLLAQHPRATVIALNLNRREFNVYGVRRVLNSDLDGLLDAIWGKRQIPGKETRKRNTKSADAENGGEAMAT